MLFGPPVVHLPPTSLRSSEVFHRVGSRSTLSSLVGEVGQAVEVDSPARKAQLALLPESGLISTVQKADESLPQYKCSLAVTSLTAEKSHSLVIVS